MKLEDKHYRVVKGQLPVYQVGPFCLAVNVRVEDLTSQIADVDCRTCLKHIKADCERRMEEL